MDLIDTEFQLICIHGISGSTAAVLSTLILYPFENMKTRMQVLQQIQLEDYSSKNSNLFKTKSIGRDSPSKSKYYQRKSSSPEAEFEEIKKSSSALLQRRKSSDCQTPQNLRPALSQGKSIIIQSSGFRDTVKEIAQKEGILGFYKGITPFLIGNYISYGIYFFWYELFKRLFHIKTDDIFGYSKIAFLSGMIASTFTNPFWTINTKMTLQKKNLGFWHTVAKILEVEGLIGLFRGILPSYILVLNPIIQFSIYEFLKNKMKNVKSKMMVYLISAIISKSLSTIFTYPYQVIRTNIHAKQNKLSTYEVFLKIYKMKGWQGFFKGLSPKLSQTVLNSAVLLIIYEKVYRFIYYLWLFMYKKISNYKP